MRYRKIMKKRQQQRRREVLTVIGSVLAGIVLSLILLFGSIKMTARTTNAENDPSSMGRTKYYKSIQIDANDSLWNIAAREENGDWDSIEAYIDEICSINGLTGSVIHAGSFLIVPYYA